MKKLKLLASSAVCAVLMLSQVFGASAATTSDGMSAELSVSSQTDSSADVTAKVKNSGYYTVDGVSYSVSVSNGVTVSGETQKSGVSLDSEAEDSLTFSVSVDTTSPTSQPSTDATSATSATTATVAGTTTASSNNSVQTGGGSFAGMIAVCAGIAFAVVLVISFKNKNKKLLSLVLCGTITLSITAVGLSSVSAAELGEVSQVTDELTIKLGDTDVVIKLTAQYPAQAQVHDNSVADLTKLNNGTTPDIVYKNNSKLSFLSGKYTDLLVTDETTALMSVNALKTLGGYDNVEAKFLKQRTNTNGDTYYYFNQTYSGAKVYGANFIVGADSDGNTISFTSSIQPTDTLVMPEQTISLEQAQSLWQTEYFVNEAKALYTEPYEVFYDSKLCYAFDYLATATVKRIAFISAEDGSLVYSTTTPLSEISDQDRSASDSFFEGLTTTNMTFTNVYDETVELPVITTQDEDGNTCYALVDTERRIIGTKYSEEVTSTYTPELYTFESAESLNKAYVTIFDYVQKIYDEYATVLNSDSVNENGVALSIRFDFTSNGQPFMNAAFDRIQSGYGLFDASEFANLATLDVWAHEFTHGIKINSTFGTDYCNTAGSLEEGYADILGNMIEMILDPEHSDAENWLMGERSGSPIRSMSNPHQFNQPEYVGDMFFVEDAQTPVIVNDCGGSHLNNSLISSISYKMYSQLGIGLEDNLKIWYDTLYTYNISPTYDDVCAYLKHALRRNNMSDKADGVQGLFEQANMLNVDSFSWDTAETPEGGAKVKVIIDDAEDYDITWNMAGIFIPKDNPTKQIQIIGSLSSTTVGNLVVPKSYFNEMNFACYIGLYFNDTNQTKYVSATQYTFEDDCLVYRINFEDIATR